MWDLNDVNNGNYYRIITDEYLSDISNLNNSSNVATSAALYSANTWLKAYTDTANTWLKSYTDTANTSLKSYVDGKYIYSINGKLSLANLKRLILVLS